MVPRPVHFGGVSAEGVTLSGVFDSCTKSAKMATTSILS